MIMVSKAKKYPLIAFGILAVIVAVVGAFYGPFSAEAAESKDQNSSLTAGAIVSTQTPSASTALTISPADKTSKAKKTLVASLSKNQRTITVRAYGGAYAKAKTVYFPVWSAKGGQNDIRWYKAKKTNGIWSVSVKLQNHLDSGKYHVHAYIQKGKKQTYVGAITTNVPQRALINFVYVKGATGSGERSVYIKNPRTLNVSTGLPAKAVTSAKTLKVKVWSKASAKKDLKTYSLKKSGSKQWVATVNCQKLKKTGTVMVQIYAGKQLIGETTFKATKDDRVPWKKAKAKLRLSSAFYKVFDHGPKPKSCQKYIVLHDTEGDGDASGVVNWWVSSGQRVAAHFIVNKNGTIVQCVPMDRIAHHAGYGNTGHNKKYGVTNESRDDKKGTVPIGPQAADYGMNSYSIGIEMVHVGGSGYYPKAQLKALDNLIAYIDAYYGKKCKIIDHKAWRSGNSDTSPEFAGYFANYKKHRKHAI